MLNLSSFHFHVLVYTNTKNASIWFSSLLVSSTVTLKKKKQLWSHCVTHTGLKLVILLSWFPKH